MHDRRHYKRFEIEGIDLMSKMNFSTEIDILDVSLCGASFTISRNLKKGEEYQLKITENDDKTFSVSGEIVWFEESDSLEIDNGEIVTVFKAGMSFKSVLTTKGDKLATLIEEKSRAGGQRSRVRGARVKLKEPKALLDDYGDYPVQEISFGGIKVNTDRQLEIGVEYKMRISIPNVLKPIKFVGRIASSKPSDNGSPGYWTGIEFIYMGVRELGIVRDVIYDLEKLDNAEIKDNLKADDSSAEQSSTGV
jgi:Tfp pilus assembly protein PilZ